MTLRRAASSPSAPQTDHLVRFVVLVVAAMSTAAGEDERSHLEDGQDASIVSGGKRGGAKRGKGKRAGAKGVGKGKGKGKGKRSGGKTGGGKGGKKAPISRAALAGLSFPVGRIHRRMKDGLLRKQRCGASAGIYAAALLEYLTAEVLELAGNACKEMKKTRITPRHILLAIKGDEELNQIITATISGGGVVPHLHAFLLKKLSKKKKKSGR